MTAYLDNSATTRPGDAVRVLVGELMESGWYNPSALYRPSMEVQKRMDEVRDLCLKVAGAEGCRMVFNLFVFEDKTHKEIADLLHIKLNTSKSQFRYAKSLLANKIKQYVKHEGER